MQEYNHCYCKRDFSASFHKYTAVLFTLQIPSPGTKPKLPEPAVRTVNANPTFVYVDEQSIVIYHCAIKKQI